ncbi:hypothetical protein DQ04_15111010, partial [Trypanosoma grayi]|uniref:hypothetical protein n=1 Tax=Trypanosoma grayi TaxID=71804 RepID=UPI0004F48B9B
CSLAIFVGRRIQPRRANAALLLLSPAAVPKHRTQAPRGAEGKGEDSPHQCGGRGPKACAEAGLLSHIRAERRRPPQPSRPEEPRQAMFRDVRKDGRQCRRGGCLCEMSAPRRAG